GRHGRCILPIVSNQSYASTAVTRELRGTIYTRKTNRCETLGTQDKTRSPRVHSRASLTNRDWFTSRPDSRKAHGNAGRSAILRPGVPAIGEVVPGDRLRTALLPKAVLEQPSSRSVPDNTLG